MGIVTETGGANKKMQSAAKYQVLHKFKNDCYDKPQEVLSLLMTKRTEEIWEAKLLIW